MDIFKKLKGIPWSMCIVPAFIGMTDYEGFGLIYVATFNYVICRPVGKIVEALKSFLKWYRRIIEISKVDLYKVLDVLGITSSEKEEKYIDYTHGEEECWLCLEKFNAVGVFVMWESDYFCCGHILCPKCTPSSAELKRCGVCRAVPPPENGLEKRIMERVRRTTRNQDK
jgi:hypothetical protein